LCPSFYYITGADFAGCAVTYDIARDNLILWIPYTEPRQALYFGSPPSPKDIKSRSHLSDVRYTSELPRYLRTYLASAANPHRCHGAPAPTTIYILHREQVPPIDYDHAAGVVCLDSTRLQPSMDAARVIKTPYEIAAIRRANAVSSAAHRSVLTRLKRMTNEREIEALFRGYCLAVGAKHQAYPVIVGSGPNAATLHYDANDEPLAGRQLIVLDAGCEWLLYASDVTRTLPVGGTLTPEARAIYRIVERMQEQCIAAVMPGLQYYRLHLMAALIATQGLLELGILTGGTADEIFAKGTAAAFFPHGLGHHVGLDVHDVSGREALMLGAAFTPALAKTRGSAGKREWITPEMMALLCRDGQTIRAPYKGRQKLVENMVVTIEPGM
jgi:Xaa-Pro dipeptidase